MYIVKMKDYKEKSTLRVSLLLHISFKILLMITLLEYSVETAQLKRFVSNNIAERVRVPQQPPLSFIPPGVVVLWFSFKKLDHFLSMYTLIQ